MQSPRENHVQNETKPQTLGKYHYGWDHPVTAQCYETFYERHDRYAEANAHLIEQAHLRDSQLILDFAAGTGHTAEAALPFISEASRIVCFEPAAAMRSTGMQRIRDPRLIWMSVLPDVQHQLDRVLCGAAIWQILPLIDIFRYFAKILKSDGVLCFDIPGLYLGQADRPGGGDDPMLSGIPTLLVAHVKQQDLTCERVPCAEEIEKQLIECGLQPKRWDFEIRWTQTAYRDWLKIPPVTDGSLGHLSAMERSKLIDDISLKIDLESWRWERWIGWTAWGAESAK